MSIKCGNCHSRHETVAEVRACYSPASASASISSEPISTIYVGPPKATAKMITFIKNLNKEREVPVVGGDTPTETTLIERNNDVMGERVITLADARAVIDWLLSRPFKSDTQFPEAPAGRYALLGDDDIWRFYQVDRPTDGQWAGFVFLRQLIGSPGDYRKERVGADSRKRILAAIAKDSRQATIDYGKQSGVCGVCSSPLTNPESLEYGIGPKCRAKTGW